jgi:hypothetical protein
MFVDGSPEKDMTIDIPHPSGGYLTDALVYAFV